jgi:hypothetical protein
MVRCIYRCINININSKIYHSFCFRKTTIDHYVVESINIIYKIQWQLKKKIKRDGEYIVYTYTCHYEQQ